MKALLTLTVFLFLTILLFGQKQETLSGYVRDAETGEELIGATVFIKELNTGGVANIYGFYSISIEPGQYTVVYSFIGSTSITKQVDLTSSQKLNIELAKSSESLKMIEVVGEAENQNVEEVQMSTIDMKMETIKKIPALMGEVDVIRAIQLLPGVQSGGEGSTGFFVRGGGLDQNLILLDEAPVYNAAHLFGFFSVFNQDAIKNAELFKGGIPAQYGGRLSSVLDVRMKEGNSKKTKLSGGIGIISSRLTIEGPLWKDKISYIISGRRTYGDLFLKLLPKSNSARSAKLFFYDLNGKINWRINDKNRVFVSAYTGRDVLGAADLFQLGWGNQTITARWNHVFNDKVFSNFTGIYSNFNYNLGVPSGPNEFLWTSKIVNYSLKNDYTWYANTKNTVKFGFQSTFHTFEPAIIEPGKENTGFNKMEFFNRFALENAVYVSNEQKIGGTLSLQYGLRFSIFSNIGTDTVYTYDKDYNNTGFDSYESGDFYNTFQNFEPRLAIKYTLNDVSSLKASYNRTAQYLHLASNSTGGAPLDVWMPSSTNTAPGLADQVAIGYFRNLKDNAIEASVELYYKTLQNQIDFADNANILLNKQLEGVIRQGRGESYGAEFFVRKNKGKLTGWVSYTLSKALRTVESINNGKTYFANYHRPHSISIVLSYAVNKKIDLAATWVYNTGTRITAPTGRLEYGGEIIPVYSDRNDAKMPDYHRADVGLNWSLSAEKEKRFKSSLNFSVYNLYARKNAFSINFKRIAQTEVKDGVKIETNNTVAEKTYLFSVIPSITWNFEF